MRSPGDPGCTDLEKTSPERSRRTENFRREVLLGEVRSASWDTCCGGVFGNASGNTLLGRGVEPEDPLGINYKEKEKQSKL